MKLKTIIITTTIFFLHLFGRSGGEMFAQITASPDTSISLCSPVCVTLKAKVTLKDTIKLATSYKMNQTIPYNADSVAGTRVYVFVNQVKGPFPIGFTFNFYGECYKEFYIGPGWISFSAGQTGTVLTVPLPDSTTNTNTSSMFYGKKKAPLNAVMLSWCDIDNSMSFGSGVYYKVWGTAPNRRLAVSWYNMLGPAAFGTFCASTDSNGTTVGHLTCLFNGQIILYETTNVIENHILNKMVPSFALPPVGANPNTIKGVPAVEGLHNKDGTKAVIVPGRNSVAWPDSVPTIYKDAVRFIPDGPIAPYKLAWYKDTALIASDTAQVKVCPTVTSTYTAKVIYTCPPDTFSDNATVTVTGGTFKVSAGKDSMICKGKSVTLQAIGGTKTSYSWAPATNLSNPKIANPIATPTITTSYIVTAYDTVCGNSSKDTVKVTVDPVNAVIAGKTSLCKGDSTKLIATGGTTYLWNTGFSKDTITVNPNANTIYSVTAANSNSCTNTAFVNITVNPLPVVKITGKNTLCSGDTTTLMASGGTTYLWSNGSTVSSIIIKPSKDTSFTVTATNTFSCSDTERVSIKVNPAPAATISGKTSLCKGDTTTLIASGGNTYSWNTGATTQSIIVETDKYSSLKNIFYVVASLGLCTDTATATVTIFSLPTAGAGNDTAICKGDSVQLSVKTNNYSSLQWTPVTGLDNPSITNPMASPDSTTQYVVTVTDSGQCVKKDTIVVSVASSFDASITPVGILCQNDEPVQLQAVGKGGTWTGNSITSNGIFSPSAAGTGKHIITYFIKGACGDTDSINITIEPLPVAGAGEDTALCYGNNVQLYATGGTSYLWSPSGNLNDASIPNPLAFPDSTTLFVVKVSSGNCYSYDTVLVTVNKVSAGFTAEPASGTTPLNVAFHNTSKNAGKYHWMLEDDFISTGFNAAHIYQSAGEYTITLIAADSLGCVDTAYFSVSVKGDVTLWIPSAFTPNQDEENERFSAITLGITDLHAIIFNRWGETIYEWDGPEGGWDGTFKGQQCQQEVYVYVITATGINGEKFTKEGTVTLIR